MATSIDKTTAKAIGEAVQEALKGVAEQFDLQVEVRGGTFDATSFKPKVEFTTANAAEDVFRTYADMYDLDPDDFGKEFTASGKRFKISGLAPQNRSRPILATEVSTGRGYKFTVDGIQRALNLKSVS